MVDDDDFLDDIDESSEAVEQEADVESLELAEKIAKEQAQKKQKCTEIRII